MAARWQGVFPPVLTPFKPNGELDLDAHLFNIDRWNRTALSGYLLLGSNSESAYLTEEEKLLLIEKTAAMVPSDKVLLAGTGMESTAATIALTRKAAARGAQAALILTPSFYHGHMTEEALITYFRQVADAVPIPVLVYNVPKFTHINVGEGLISALCDHPNIVGMKDSSGNLGQLVTFQAVSGDSFDLLVGTAAIWYPGLTLGIRGGIMALANVFPEACVDIQQFVITGRHAEAEQLYRLLYPVNHALTATYGVAGLKYAADRMGWIGGAVRGPLLPLRETQRRALDGILEKTGLL